MWPTEQNRQAWDRRHAHREPGPMLPEIVRDRLAALSGKHVLHLRCGTGETSAELIGLGALVTGVDPSEQALALARERAPGAVFFCSEVEELPLQLRRRRFDAVYAGEGTLAGAVELTPLLATVAAALRKGGRLFLHDRHPVSLCVEPVALRWRESYFAEGFWRLGQVVVAVVQAGLAVDDLEELPPATSETGGRLDPRIPSDFLLVATKTEAALPAPVRGKRRS
jgi:SAM-dependent methyltransferase